MIILIFLKFSCNPKQPILCFSLNRVGLSTLVLALRTNETFVFPGATVCSPANQQSVIELVPGVLAATSTERQADPKSRLGECEVHPASCISLSPRDASEEEALPWQALNRPSWAECKLGASFSSQLSRKDKNHTDPIFRMQDQVSLHNKTAYKGSSKLVWCWMAQNIVADRSPQWCSASFWIKIKDDINIDVNYRCKRDTLTPSLTEWWELNLIAPVKLETHHKTAEKHNALRLEERFGRR